MKNSFEKVESINFKKLFAAFFIALGIFAIAFVSSMLISGEADFARVLERITLARLRGRMFTDVRSTFRFFSYFFLIGFNALLALWVYVDGKKMGSHRALWPALTLITGLIGWLIYLIRRVDRIVKVEKENGICQ